MIRQRIQNTAFTGFTWAGISIFSGLAKDGFCELTYNNDRTASNTDAGGNSYSVSKMSNRDATVSITLMQNSEANIALTALMRREDITGQTVIDDIDIETGGALFLYDLEECHVQSMPPQNISQSAADATQTWVFYCARMRPKDLTAFTGIQDEIISGIRGQVDVAISIEI